MVFVALSSCVNSACSSYCRVQVASFQIRESSFQVPVKNEKGPEKFQLSLFPKVTEPRIFEVFTTALDTSPVAAGPKTLKRYQGSGKAGRVPVVFFVEVY